MFNVHIAFKLSWQLWHCCSGCTVILWGQLRPRYPQKITLQPQQLFYSGQLRWSTGLWTFTKCDSFTHHLCKNVGPRKTSKIPDKSNRRLESYEWLQHWFKKALRISDYARKPPKIKTYHSHFFLYYNIMPIYSQIRCEMVKFFIFACRLDGLQNLTSLSTFVHRDDLCKRHWDSSPPSCFF